jgi:hypothetical protein
LEGFLADGELQVESLAVPKAGSAGNSAQAPLYRTCSIRIVSVHLLDAAGRLLRVLFLDHQAARLL